MPSLSTTMKSKKKFNDGLLNVVKIQYEMEKYLP